MYVEIWGLSAKLQDAAAESWPELPQLTKHEQYQTGQTVTTQSQSSVFGLCDQTIGTDFEIKELSMVMRQWLTNGQTETDYTALGAPLVWGTVLGSIPFPQSEISELKRNFPQPWVRNATYSEDLYLVSVMICEYAERVESSVAMYISLAELSGACIG